MTDHAELEKAIQALEAQRAVLGDDVVNAMVAAAREKLAALEVRPITEQRKQVTVLFADVSGFTSMAETLDPEEVHDTINAVWKRLDAVLTSHGGSIDKHMGDAVMALFGTPTAHEDDPERAIQAALAMQAEIQQFVDAHGGLPLHIRIGINTGPVLLGTVGSTAEYTAIGDAVNVARRLQHAAPAGGVLVSQDTYRHVRGVFDVQMQEPIKLRGKAKPTQTYVILAAKPRAFRLPSRGVEGIETRMIGRDTELQQLQEILRAVMTQSESQIVTIVGEAGVGKSRLLFEFTKWIELLPESVRFFKGRTDPQMSQLPYSLIRDFLAFRFEINEMDPADVAREKLEQGFAQFMGAEGEEKAHFVGHLIGLDFSKSPHLKGILTDARQIRDRAFLYLKQFFQAVTQEQPAVLFLEDIHWADRGALDLIDYLARECRQSPLLIVTLARPLIFDRRPMWSEGWPAYTRLDLHLLSREESAQLVREILHKMPTIPTVLIDLVVMRTEGNPFYIEEMIKMLIEDGVIAKGADIWTVRPERLLEARVPPTLTGVLQARMDRLSPVEREMIQRAAVVGRVFWDGAVAHLGQGDPESVLEALNALREKEWLYARRDSALFDQHEFVFKHALLYEVSYESVLKRRRRTYHAEVAEWLIERSGGRAEEYAGLIGEHYERAGKTARASEWYGRAGKQAEDAYAPESAINYYQKALAFLPDVTRTELADETEADAVTGIDTLRASYYEGLGNEWGRLGRYAEAEEAYTAMRTAAETAGDRTAQSRAWDRLAWVHDSQGEYHAAFRDAERAEEIAREAGAQIELVRALHSQGRIFLKLGDPEKASAFAEQALTLSTELDAKYDMAHSMSLLGAIHYILGDHDQAAKHMEAALSINLDIDNQPGVGAAFNDLAATAQARGDYQSAVTLYQDALVIFGQIGHREGEVVCLSNLGGARVQLGEHLTAEANLREVIELTQPGSWFLSETYRFLAEAYLGQGKRGAALAAAQRALTLGQETEQQEFIGGAWRTLGLVAAQLAEPVTVGDGTYDAPACFAESLRVFSEISAEAERARTLWAWAKYELEKGDKETGAAKWEEARETFQRLGMELEVARMSE